MKTTIFFVSTAQRPACPLVGMEKVRSMKEAAHKTILIEGAGMATSQEIRRKASGTVT
jgi:hypothetical protein